LHYTWRAKLDSTSTDHALAKKVAKKATVYNINIQSLINQQPFSAQVLHKVFS
jgi:hypothetical protein